MVEGLGGRGLRNEGVGKKLKRSKNCVKNLFGLQIFAPDVASMMNPKGGRNDRNAHMITG